MKFNKEKWNDFVEFIPDLIHSLSGVVGLISLIIYCLVALVLLGLWAIVAPVVWFNCWEVNLG